MTDTPTHRQRTKYLEPELLAALVREYRRTKTVSDELGRGLLAIAGGVWARYFFGPDQDRDDFVQAAVMFLITKPLKGCDPKRNPFSYLTTCLIRWGRRRRDRAHAEHRLFQAYGQALELAGVPIPAAD